MPPVAVLAIATHPKARGAATAETTASAPLVRRAAREPRLTGARYLPSGDLVVYVAVREVMSVEHLPVLAPEARGGACRRFHLRATSPRRSPPLAAREIAEPRGSSRSLAVGRVCAPAMGKAIDARRLRLKPRRVRAAEHHEIAANARQSAGGHQSIAIGTDDVASLAGTVWVDVTRPALDSPRVWNRLELIPLLRHDTPRFGVRRIEYSYARARWTLRSQCPRSQIIFLPFLQRLVTVFGSLRCRLISCVCMRTGLRRLLESPILSSSIPTSLRKDSSVFSPNATRA